VDGLVVVGQAQFRRRVGQQPEWPFLQEDVCPSFAVYARSGGKLYGVRGNCGAR